MAVKHSGITVLALLATLVISCAVKADVFVCADTTCAAPTLKPKANLSASDLVKWCRSGTVTAGNPSGCTNQQIIGWGQMESYSWVLTDTGWYRVSDVPTTAPASPPPPSTTPSTTSITVSWGAPTQYTDGSALTVAGYHVFYGTTTGGPYTTVVNALASPAVIPLAAGAYYFVVTAYDKAGVESAYSNEASATVVDATPAPTPAPAPTVSTTEVLGTWTLKKGTTNIQTGLPDYAACKALAQSKATTTATKYYCAVSNALTVVLK